MRTKLVDGVRVDLTLEEDAARDAEEAAEAAKPPPEKVINIVLTRAEGVKLVNFYKTNNIITQARATELKS